MKLRDICNIEEVLSTKEKRGLFFWPLMAIFMETFQEHIVFHVFDIRRTVYIFILAAVVFVGTFIVFYRGKA